MMPWTYSFLPGNYMPKACCGGWGWALQRRLQGGWKLKPFQYLAWQIMHVFRGKSKVLNMKLFSTFFLLSSSSIPFLLLIFPFSFSHFLPISSFFPSFLFFPEMRVFFLNPECVDIEYFSLPVPKMYQKFRYILQKVIAYQVCSWNLLCTMYVRICNFFY